MSIASAFQGQGISQTELQMCSFVLPSPSGWDLRFCGTLRSVQWQFITDVSEKPIGPIFVDVSGKPIVSHLRGRFGKTYRVPSSLTFRENLYFASSWTFRENLSVPSSLTFRENLSVAPSWTFRENLSVASSWTFRENPSCPNFVDVSGNL
jgi:hypothetical protein